MNQPFEHGYALIIGVDQNAVAGWELPDVAKDILALNAILTHPQRCAYPPEQVRVLTGAEATRENILEGLDWLKEKLEADKSGDATALIYYSGHGWQDNTLSQPAYYLIPYNVTRANLGRTALSAQLFAQEIAALTPRRLLVLLDCCHAGGMGVKELEGSNLAPFSIPPDWLLSGQKSIALDAGGPSGKDLDTSRLTQGSGRSILNSSRSNEKSYIRKDGAMSIFTYHLIEALTGYAPHGAEDQEVTAADLLSHVWRKVPPSAQADHHCPQHPDGQISGNFPIALLLGGEGAPPGKSLPDPLEPLPPEKTPGRQPRQSNNQINIQGGINTGPEGTVIIATGNVNQTHNTGNSSKVGNITGSAGIAIGPNARASAYQAYGSDSLAIEKTFASLLERVNHLADEDQKNDARDALAKLEEEARKGEQVNESRVEKWLGFLAGMAGDIFDIAVAAFINPLSGLGTAFRKIAERAKAEQKQYPK